MCELRENIRDRVGQKPRGKLSKDINLLILELDLSGTMPATPSLGKPWTRLPI
jgi:hypothetical protein